MNKRTRELKEGGARGGAAATGEKKRRKMQGVRPGRGSAGRADHCGTPDEDKIARVERRERVTARMFYLACVKFLEDRDPTYKKGWQRDGGRSME